LLLFVIGAFVSLIEPSWHRLADQIVLDSAWDVRLRYVYPSLLSGIINLWIGIGMLVVVAAFTAFLFVALYYAIAWQIDQLYLKTTIWQLIIFFSVSGGLLLTRVFFRLIPHIPRPQHSSMISVVSLTMGATLIFPITWLFNLRSASKTSWILIATAALGACLVGGYLLLFGEIFNPWFTAFSYLKGAIIKIVSVALAGIVALLTEQRLHRRIGAPFRFRRQGVTLAIGNRQPRMKCSTPPEMPSVPCQGGERFLCFLQLMDVHNDLVEESRRPGLRRLATGSVRQ
jgi:hypothetical protein